MGSSTVFNFSINCGYVAEILEGGKLKFAELDNALAQRYGILTLLCILGSLASNCSVKTDHTPQMNISYYIISTVGSA
jgi:hypothetical protein